MKYGKLSILELSSMVSYPFSNLVELDLCIFAFKKVQIDQEIKRLIFYQDPNGSAYPHYIWMEIALILHQSPIWSRVTGLHCRLFPCVEEDDYTVNNFISFGCPQIVKANWPSLFFLNLYKNQMYEHSCIQLITANWSLLSTFNLCIFSLSQKKVMQPVPKKLKDFRSNLLTSLQDCKNLLYDQYYNNRFSNRKMRLRQILFLINRPYYLASTIKPQIAINIINKPNPIKDKYANYSPITKRIINEMTKRKIDFDLTYNLLYELFKKHQQYSDATPDDFLQIINILSIVQSKNLQELKRHKITMLESINKFFDIVEIDSECLENYIKAQRQYRITIKQKTKTNRMLYNLLITVQYNIKNLYPKYYIYILDLILNDVHQVSKFKKIAENILSFLSPIFKKQKEYDGDISKLLEKVSQAYKIYGVSNAQDFHSFYQYLTNTFMAKKKQSKIIEDDLNNLSIIFMNFNYKIRDSTGQRYKSLLANELNHFFSISYYKYSQYRYKFCSALLNYYFYLHSTSLKMIEQGSISYLPRKSLGPRPQVPEIFWKIYKQNPQLLNYVDYMKCIIKDIYPQRFIPTSGYNNKTIQPFLETEMKIRVQESFLLLGLKYQSEVEISGRYIDFLIDDNIILEIDGSFHIDATNLEADDVTQCRNMHLIYAGFRLVSINIYEYNMAREVSELKQLIKAKLQILRDNDCVFVN